MPDLGPQAGPAGARDPRPGAGAVPSLCLLGAGRAGTATRVGGRGGAEGGLAVLGRAGVGAGRACRLGGRGGRRVLAVRPDPSVRPGRVPGGAAGQPGRGAARHPGRGPSVRGAGDRPGPPPDHGPRPEPAEGAGGGDVRRPGADPPRLPDPRRVPGGERVPGRARPSPLPAPADGPADRPLLEGRPRGGPGGPPGPGPRPAGPPPGTVRSAGVLKRARPARGERAGRRTTLDPGAPDPPLPPERSEPDPGGRARSPGREGSVSRGAAVS